MFPVLLKMDRKDLILHLFKINAIKFGSFTLKSGLLSPLYIDLRVIISDPKLMVQVSELLWNAACHVDGKFDSVCGVPYTALPLATLMSANNDVPMLMRRKEVKTYGTKKAIEGYFEPGNVCLVVEDIVTSGSSVLETVEALQGEGIVVRNAVVLLDREQGGKERLHHLGIKLHSVLGLSHVLSTLLHENKITQETFDDVTAFIAQNQFVANSVEPVVQLKPAAQILRYAERASLAKHPLAKQLFTLMDSKNTNLAFAADVTESRDLLQLTDKVGPYICLLKTHVDVLKDFTQDTAEKLLELARKHRFLIFEDRKFADIGETVREQYSGGIHTISSWSDLVTVHSLPGPGIISGLKQVNPDKACVIVAEMSSAGNFLTSDYTKRSVELAEQNRDFVIGCVCQSRLSDDPSFIHLTPGIHMDVSGDDLGQQFQTPRDAITRRRCDVIIVGRGIRNAADPVAAAKMYRDAGFSAYCELLQ